MKRVATAVVLIPIVLLIVFRAPMWAFAVVVGIIALITTNEFLGLAESSGIKPARGLVIFMALLLFASLVAGFLVETAVSRLPPSSLIRGTFPREHPQLYMAFGASSLARDLVLLAAFVLLVGVMRREDLRSSLAGAAASTLALAYVSLPLMLLITVRARMGGAFYVLYLLVVVWIGDILAFFVGSAIGKHKLAPRISPNKSWEGATASLVAATGVGTAMLAYGDTIVGFLRNTKLLAERTASIFSVGQYPLHHRLWVYVVLSAVLNLAAQIGDLVESMLKRGAGVKDSGALLPGHGGMLDRIDALLFAAPVLWYYAQIAATIGSR
jgi:phosphatidate cytidylyltransferase